MTRHSLTKAAAIFLYFPIIVALYIEDGMRSFAGNRGVGFSDNEPVPLNGIAPSSKCWQSAISLLNVNHGKEGSAGDAAALCAVLPEAYQKRLALEIAQCHLNDLGKEMYRDDVKLQCSTKAVEIDTVLLCLKNLTPTAENAYTIYLTYVQHLCIRLIQELLLKHQQDTQRDLTSKYAELSGQSMEQIEAMSEISKQHTDQMNELSKIPNKVMSQLSNEVVVHIKETLKHSLEQELKSQLNQQLKDQLEISLSGIMDNFATEQMTILERFADELNHRDFENKERLEEWTHYQVAMWQKQAHLMETQQEKFYEHQERIEKLSKNVLITTQNMQPLLGLQHLIQIATTGYTWITFLLYFVGTFNIIWLITRPQRCHAFRTYLFSLIFSEAILELLMTLAVRYETLLENDRILYTTEMRRWVILLECLFYIAGVVMSLFVDFRARDPISDKDNVSREDFFDLLHDLQQPADLSYDSYGAYNSIAKQFVRNEQGPARNARFGLANTYLGTRYLNGTECGFRPSTNVAGRGQQAVNPIYRNQNRKQMLEGNQIHLSHRKRSNTSNSSNTGKRLVKDNSETSGAGRVHASAPGSPYATFPVSVVGALLNDLTQEPTEANKNTYENMPLEMTDYSEEDDAEVMDLEQNQVTSVKRPLQLTEDEKATEDEKKNTTHSKRHKAG